MDIVSVEPGEVSGVGHPRRGMVQALYGPFAKNTDIPFSHWYSDWAGKIFNPDRTKIVKFTDAVPLGGVKRGVWWDERYSSPHLR